MPITVISVAKSYSNRGNHRHRQRTKKHWYLYYIDHEDLKFKSKRIGTIEALFYMPQKHRPYGYTCPDCGASLTAYVKSLKEEVECPYCHFITNMEALDYRDEED
jgi:ssDNA-binding Zn-finger/Zn-ribbon topoisomerase 1